MLRSAIVGAALTLAAAASDVAQGLSGIGSDGIFRITPQRPAAELVRAVRRSASRSAGGGAEIARYDAVSGARTVSVHRAAALAADSPGANESQRDRDREDEHRGQPGRGGIGQLPPSVADAEDSASDEQPAKAASQFGVYSR